MYVETLYCVSFSLYVPQQYTRTIFDDQVAPSIQLLTANLNV